MKGKIEGTGQLSIERAGQWIGCFCKRNATVNGYSACNHYCPHFKEPEAEMRRTMGFPVDGASEPTGRTIVRICEGTVWIFDEFKDGRGGA